MAECICFVRAVTMKPHSGMRADDDHAVNNKDKQQLPGKIIKHESKKERQHACEHQPANE
jgi:hypothetical protein